MEAIDLNILFDETDELPIGWCDGCGAPIEFDGDACTAGSAVYCRECAESGVFPA